MISRRKERMFKKTRCSTIASLFCIRKIYTIFLFQVTWKVDFISRPIDNRSREYWTCDVFTTVALSLITINIYIVFYIVIVSITVTVIIVVLVFITLYFVKDFFLSTTLSILPYSLTKSWQNNFSVRGALWKIMLG